jgi:hypothetical protein
VRAYAGVCVSVSVCVCVCTLSTIPPLWAHLNTHTSAPQVTPGACRQAYGLLPEIHSGPSRRSKGEPLHSRPANAVRALRPGPAAPLPDPSAEKPPAKLLPGGADAGCGSSSVGSDGGERGPARTPYQAEDVQEATGEEAEVPGDGGGGGGG